MTLDQLLYFQAVCKYNGVSQAAKHLNISQPSVSAAISKLENEFGTMLFTRQSKRLTLTKEGTRLLELANDLLSGADNIAKTMQDLRNDRVLNLGIPPMLSSYILPILYGDFLKSHPDFKINIVEDDRSGLMGLLEENKIDMAFLPHDQPFDSRFHAKHLTELANVCCVNREHRLANKKTVKIQDLKDEPLVLFKNSFFQTERILERFKQKEYAPNILLDTAQVSTVQNMAANGLAVGVIFAFLLKTTPELVGIPFDPPMYTQVSLVWKQGEYLSGNMNQLIGFFHNFSACE